MVRSDLYTTYWKDALSTLKYTGISEAIDNLPQSWHGVKHVEIRYYNGVEYKCRVLLGNKQKAAYKPTIENRESFDLKYESLVGLGINIICEDLDTGKELETPSDDVIETLYYLACTYLHPTGDYTEYTDIFCNTPLITDRHNRPKTRNSIKEVIQGYLEYYYKEVEKEGKQER